MNAKTLVFGLAGLTLASPVLSQVLLGSLGPGEVGIVELASNIPGVGARAMGMAGAFTALADDATAASWNPAGLVNLTGPEASIVFEFLEGDIDLRGGEESGPVFDGSELLSFNSFTLIDETGGSDYETPSFLSATYLFQLRGRPAALQLGARHLFEIPSAREDRLFRVQLIGVEAGPVELSASDSSRTSGSGGIDVVSLSGAWEPREDLRVGVTLNYLNADYSFRQADDFAFSDEASVVLEGSQRVLLKESFSDWFADLGVQWDITKRWVVGAVYHSGFTTDFDYTTTVTATQTDALFLGPSTAGGTGRVRWPESYALGIAFKPSGRLRVAADYSESGWSDGERDGFQFPIFERITSDDENGLLVLEPAVGEETGLPYPNFGAQQDTQAIRLGGEYVYFVSDLVVPVRAGVFEEEGMSGVFPEVNREPRTIRGWSLGGGLTYKKLAVDLAWVHSESDEDIFFSETRLSSVNGDPIELPATLVVDHFKIETDRFIASLMVRF